MSPHEIKLLTTRLERIEAQLEAGAQSFERHGQFDDASELRRTMALAKRLKNRFQAHAITHPAGLP